MVKRAAVESAAKELNELGLTGKIKVVGVSETDLKESFLKSIDAFLDKEGTDAAKKLSKNIRSVYNDLLDESTEKAPSEGKDEVAPETEKPPQEEAEEKPTGKTKKGPQKKPEKKPVEKEEKVKETKPSKSETEANDSESSLTLENCPEDYETLKAQSKILALSSMNTFFLLGQRVMKIRDGELYKEDGYKTFKDFIANELQVKRSQTYNAIDVVKYFGVQSIEHHSVDPSTLIQALPLLKADEEKLDKSAKKEIKNLILKEAKTKSEREMKELVKGLKVKYGLVEEKEEVNKFDATFNRLYSLFPEELNGNDKKRIQKYIKKLQELVG